MSDGPHIGILFEVGPFVRAVAANNADVKIYDFISL